MARVATARLVGLAAVACLVATSCRHAEEEPRGDWCATDRVRIGDAFRALDACHAGDAGACEEVARECDMGDTVFCDPDDAAAPDASSPSIRNVKTVSSADPSDTSSADVASDVGSPPSSLASSNASSTNEIGVPSASPDPRKLLASCVTAKTRTRGCMSVRLVVNADGKVVSSGVDGVEDAATVGCVTRRATQLRFPPTNGERRLDLPINCAR